MGHFQIYAEYCYMDFDWFIETTIKGIINQQVADDALMAQLKIGALPWRYQNA